MSYTFTKQDWEYYARCYDSLLQLEPYTAVIDTVVKELETHEEGSILDASCGTGNFLKAFLEKHPHFKNNAIGIDAAESMLERAKEKCAQYPSISFVKTDLDTALPFEDGSFGYIVCINTLYAVKEPTFTMKEFHRVLRKNGIIFIVTPKDGYENGLILKAHCKSEQPDSYWRNLHQEPVREESLIREAIKDEHTIGQMLTVARFNKSIAVNEAFHFFTDGTIKPLIEDSGFQLISTSPTYANQSLFITAHKNTI